MSSPHPPSPGGFVKHSIHEEQVSSKQFFCTNFLFLTIVCNFAQCYYMYAKRRNFLYTLISLHQHYTSFSTILSKNWVLKHQIPTASAARRTHSKNAYTVYFTISIQHYYLWTKFHFKWNLKPHYSKNTLLLKWGKQKGCHRILYEFSIHISKCHLAWQEKLPRLWKLI